MRVVVILAAVVVALAAAPAASVRSFRGDGTQVALGSALAAASPAPCNDTKYSFIGPSSAWASTLGWRFRASSTPAGLSSSAALGVIKKSFKNIVNSRNDCGLADEVTATSSYLGTTSRKPGVSASGSCTAPDGYSVIGFAPLDGYYAGYTCIWWNDANQIYEMDMRLDPDQPWALSLVSCNSELMMESLVTHEVGHAFGLGHVSEDRHGRLTMSVLIDGLCENHEATLGLGDVLGLRALY